ncbi:serine dehydratase alpha chain-domain-containing protein [Dioszegia hungarica]|uniref:Serine dehydratase alpha chain-domain-containing protein n=1 Tax=Dioszegia hungarica TaxID=4972 RepID=A0AA38LX91_9TREE|nr:serine dehydratase alpha chain-domain-containing protein [Dioszegia hungarica]KAI9638233.1 serine dehydratase alpha chain-domain-containing protein [Dioszegia hungarica]
MSALVMMGQTRAMRRASRLGTDLFSAKTRTGTLLLRPYHPSSISGYPFATSFRSKRLYSSTAASESSLLSAHPVIKDKKDGKPLGVRAEHAVISTFDLFSIGVGPSSSHTVGPMRAAKIFVHSLPAHIHPHIASIKCSLHGSLAATGMGHMTPHATLLGLMGEDPETVEVGRLERVMDEVKDAGGLSLGLGHGKGTKRVKFDLDRDLTWHLNPLPAHPNGLRFTVFNNEGDMLATNEFFSVGGGFVINEETQTAENMYYMGIDKEDVEASRKDQTHGMEQADASDGGQLLLPEIGVGSAGKQTAGGGTRTSGTELSGRPPFLFATAEELNRICLEQDMTIAQVVWENELAFRSADEIRAGLLGLWEVMDSCIRTGVTSLEPVLPGPFKVRRRAPGLYRRLQKGFYPTVEINRATSSDLSSVNPDGSASTEKGIAKRVGRADHPLQVVPFRTTPVFPGIEYLSCMAIAVNEVNAAGGRVVTAPTNGAAGVIPATLKYVTEFISHSPERDIMTFLLTASAIGMLFKRGATISAAEGGCMAEVGVACSMSAGAIAACLGAEPAVILQAAEIGIEQRNSLGAVKAVTAAQLAMAGEGQHTVSLDDAIEACRTTALDMHSHYKETSLAGLATTVQIPLSSPAC